MPGVAIARPKESATRATAIIVIAAEARISRGDIAPTIAIVVANSIIPADREGMLSIPTLLIIERPAPSDINPTPNIAIAAAPAAINNDMNPIPANTRANLIIAAPATAKDSQPTALNIIRARAKGIREAPNTAIAKAPGRMNDAN